MELERVKFKDEDDVLVWLKENGLAGRNATSARPVLVAHGCWLEIESDGMLTIGFPPHPPVEDEEEEDSDEPEHRNPPPDDGWSRP